jgi:hypothetical protein
MNSAQILVRILGEATLDEVRTAFTGVHLQNPRYRWDCTVEMRGEIIHIEGSVYFDDHVVGEFKRRLYYEKGARRAKHIMMELQTAHQDLDVAKNHYGRILRFYRRCGIRFVHLDADVDGPAIWPQFAFDLERRQDKEQLARIMRDHGIEGVASDPQDLFAPDVASIENETDPEDAEPLGFRLLKELRIRADRPLPMVLDLQNQDQWTLLVAGGIIGREELR